MNDVKARELKDLIDAHTVHGAEVLNPYLTHAQRMVNVLPDMIERNIALMQAMGDYAQGPSLEAWRTIVMAQTGVNTKIAELLEAYQAVAEDTVAIMALVQDALIIVRVAAND